MAFPRFCWFTWQPTLQHPISGCYMRGVWDAVEGFPPTRSLRHDKAEFREAYEAGRAAGKAYLAQRPWLAPEPVAYATLLDRLRA